MDDELGLMMSGLDQSLPIESDDVLKWIEDIVQQSVREHNAQIALRALRNVVKLNKLSGITLAKGLYMLKESWSSYEIKEDFDTMAYLEIGLAKPTVDRYVSVWEMKESKIIPGNLEAQIMQRNIKDLIPIATALKQGNEIEEEDWERLADAPDFSSVGAIIRDVTGRPPRAGSLQLSVDDKGTIMAYKDGDVYWVGALNVNEKDETIQQAIERLIRGAGVMRR